MLIAIDGPAASGKGTVGKMVAQHFHLEYLDTGRLYRLVGYILLNQFPDIEASKLDNTEAAIKIAENLDTSDINNEKLESELVGMMASKVSAIPEVRSALMDFQRRVAASPKGAVLDGRDIGTVICPNADFKFFITAEADTRAKRRYNQLKLRKKNIKEAQVLEDILSRDRRDKGRTIAPLVPAIDAIYIDTTNLSIEAVFEKVKEVIKSSNISCSPE